MSNPALHPYTKNELLKLILECNTEQLNGFIEVLADQRLEIYSVVSTARNMGLEPLNLTNLLEAMNKLKEDGK